MSLSLNTCHLVWLWSLQVKSPKIKKCILTAGLNIVALQHTELRNRMGRAIAQAVSRRLPTAAAQVRVRDRSCGICGGQSGAEVGFLRVLRFPLPIFIPSIAPQSPLTIIWGWYNRPVVAAVPSGLSHHTNNNNNNKNTDSY
jgi:hypothetical protein